MSQDLRKARVIPETLDEFERLDYAPEYRVDLERIRFSPYFSRLSAVTQVISQGSTGPVIHNRLTHSVKVTSVARSIAISLNGVNDEDAATIAQLGGCDAVVVQAASSAHDLGHPPFGHLGEQVLDRLGRERLGLAEGFEGNAQTFRIMCSLDNSEASASGLNLTAAVRAGVLKYPWLRQDWKTTPQDSSVRTPRGVGSSRTHGADKFSAYELNLSDLESARAAFPDIAPFQQTIECAVMDIADDIAYSIHDLDDFYRAGVLQQAAVSAELRGWQRDRAELAALDKADLLSRMRQPGAGLEKLRRHIVRRDPWVANEEAFAASVARVSEDLADGVLAVPYDGGIIAERAISRFTRSWIARLQRSIIVDPNPDVRSGYVRLGTAAWHDVAVLKFVHRQFVLQRADLATYQRGQARVLETLVDGFADWLADHDDAQRAPLRLIELTQLAHEGYQDLAVHSPELVQSDADLRRMGTARGILDYVASLTDDQAVSLAALFSGTSSELWEAGKSL